MCKLADGRINNEAGLRARKFIKAKVCSIKCDFSDMRIGRNTVLEGRCQYEVADNNENQGDSERVGIIMCEVGFISLHIFINVNKT